MSVSINRGRRSFASTQTASPPQKAFGEVVEYALKESPAKVRIKLLLPLKHNGAVIPAGTVVEAYNRPPPADFVARRDKDGNEMLPRTVERMVRAVGSGAPLSPGSVVELDTVWIDKSGALTFRGAHGIAPASTMQPEVVTNPETGQPVNLKAKNVAMANVLWMVGTPRKPTPPATRYRQSCTTLLVEKAAVAKDRDGNYMPYLDSFVTAIVKAPSTEGKGHFDFLQTPAFLVVARREGGAEDPLSRNATLVYLFQKKDESTGAYRPQTVEEAIATFQAQLAEEKDEDGVDKMADILSGKVKGYNVEVVPGIFADLAPDLVASSASKRDMADDCRLFDGGGEKPIEKFGTGFVNGIVAFSRYAMDNIYSIKMAGTTDRYPDVFALMDIPTKHMDQDHLAAVSALATSNSTLARTYRTANSSYAKDKDQSDKNGSGPELDQIPF